MDSALRRPHALQAHDQSFLCQPPTYSSGEDGDSPPSLTHSSESPRSASEEGSTNASGPSTKRAITPSHLPHHLSTNPHARATAKDATASGAGLAQNRRAMKSELGPHAASFTGMMYDAEQIDGESNAFASSTSHASPNWDTVFGVVSNAPNAPYSAEPGNDASDAKQFSHQIPRQSGAQSSGESATSASQNAQPAWVAGISRWQQQQQVDAADEDAKMTDDALFASIIQEDSFEDGSSKDVSSISGGSEQSSDRIDSTRSSVANVVTPPCNDASTGQILSRQRAKASTSQMSSRRNSAEQDASAVESHITNRIPHSGSHYSHTSDADLPSSSQVIVRPAPEDLHGLQVHVHGISTSGAKSRVETQIRLRLDLVRNAPQSSEPAFERIGAFHHIKLPPMTGTKRRSKKHRPTDIVAEKTLFMDAAVVRATPPHERVYVCRSCQQREKKRAQRRKTGTRREDGKGNRGDTFSLDDLQELGIDPKAPDAQAKARIRSEQEDERRVVVFNCGDFVAFEEGTCILPTRITCYCRHHREKTGFCLVFTMRNYRGDVIATGSTPPIMITDDHKSVGAAVTSVNAKKSEANTTRSRQQSSELAPAPVAASRGVGTDTTKVKRRQNRSKPYGDADERSSARRSTISSSAAATPYPSSTGHTTPALPLSPSNGPDLSHPEFWNAFATMTNIANSCSPAEGSRSSISAPTPHELPSPTTMPASSQPIASSNSQILSPVEANQMHSWIADAAAHGSLSSHTLGLGPQSLPGFDLGGFLQSMQRSQMQGDEASLQQLMMLARSLPNSSLEELNGMRMSGQAHLHHPAAPTAPQPLISKLIPGEGPTSGGIEVTILGENFEEGQTCFFGDVPATSTKVWGSNTLLCILPPSASPGPVAVTVKSAGFGEVMASEHQSRTLQLFTYTDTTDRALMELALQVVGLQMTGQMQSARDVAMRVVGSGPNQSMTRAQASGVQSGSQHSQSMASRDAVSGIFTGGGSAPNASFQDSVLSFLQVMDVDLAAMRHVRPRRDAIRLANKQGHTLLHLSVILGFHRLAIDLIRRGCPVNARDHAGMTALHFCALRGRVTLARLLLSHGAIANVQSEAGKTPLDIALEEDQPDVESLLDYGTEEDDVDESAATESLLSDEDDIESHVDADHQESITAESDILGDSNQGELAEASPAQTRAFSPNDEKLLESLSPPTSSNLARGKAEVGKHAKDAQSASEKSIKDTDTASGFKALVINSLDLATKARFGVPMVLHEGLNTLQMPVISVFQMALPPSIANWATIGETSRGDNDAERTGKIRQSDNASEHEASPRSSRWRNIVEESALWINPLSTPPPPAYESLSITKELDRASSSMQGYRKTSRTTSPDAHASTSSSTQSRGNKLVSEQHSKSSARPTGVSTPSKQRGHLRDDRMLVYFWVPILIFVLLLLCFANPSSVLSYEDLRSFVPVA